MKKQTVGFLKSASAMLLFWAPCALCLLLLKERLPENVLLYSYSGALWIVTPIAGISAAAALISRSTDSEELSEEEDETDAFFDAEENLSEDGQFIEEYSELYKNPGEDDAPAKAVPDIAAAISAQKSAVPEGCDADGGADERERIWNEFVSDKADKESETDSIYDTLPDTLPEGFSFTEDEEDDASNEDTDEEGEDMCPRRTFPAMRAAAAVICAASVLTGALLSRVYVADTARGVSVGRLFGTASYSWSDTEIIEVSPDITGDGLRIRAHMSDGKKYTLCSGLMLRGDGAAEHFGTSDAELYAYICEKAESAGARVSVRDRKTIESSFRDTEDWEYISGIINKAK